MDVTMIGTHSPPSPAVYEKLLDGAILLTGAPRSGTTLLGKLVSTLQGVEYHFEPPTFYMLSASSASSELAHDKACRLLRTYMVEDLLLESAQGRALNFRPCDDSQVFNRLSWKEVNNRWSCVANRKDAIEFCIANDLRLCIKSPNVMNATAVFERSVSNAKIVVIQRNGSDVVRSIVAKGWLDDVSLQTELWPYIAKKANINIPYWVPDEFLDKWQTMSPIARCALMWSVHTDFITELVDQRNIYTVKYEDLTLDPRHKMKEIAEFTGRSFTQMTESLFQHVRQPKNGYGLPSIFDQLQSEDVILSERFAESNNMLGYTVS
jgi:hypothetical protein